VTRARADRPREESVGLLAVWLARQLPGLAEDRARAIVGKAAGYYPGILPVHIRTNRGAVCSTCHERPAHRCEGCGQMRPLARRAGPDGPALCAVCHHLPDRVCVSCRRLRPCYRRRADGNT
jgi:hypothetical protein